MASENTFPLYYKGKPLLRSGDVLYYGDISEKFVIKMNIKSKKPYKDTEFADKVTVQLINTDPDISPRKSIVKTSEKENLYLALDIADIWLERALKG